VDYGNPDAGPVIGPGLVAEDGVKVTWGRGNTVDQPAPSTCTMRVLDMPDDPTYFDTLTIGETVEVWAEGATGSTGDVEAFTGGGFESGAVNGWPTTNAATLTRSTTRAYAGTGSAAIAATKGLAEWGAILAPAEVQPAGGGDPATRAVAAAFAMVGGVITIGMAPRCRVLSGWCRHAMWCETR
jgi:hypothetical protein